MPDVNDFNAPIVDEFRANHGKVGGAFEGAQMLLLTTTGAKSGRRRTSPLMYRREGERLYIFGSYVGADTHPAWYHNLLADPTATVELGDDEFETRAEVVTGPERDDVWTRHVAAVPGFGDYQAKTDRVIPVVELGRV